jgi:tetratricopeptide (TPR) repeat protein
LLRAGDLERAAAETDEAVRLEPQSLWPNYCQGVCAYRRGQFADAAAAFGVSIGAAPDAAGCYVNRALAFAALGRTETALRDYDRALRLDGSLATPNLDKLRRR